MAHGGWLDHRLMVKFKFVFLKHLFHEPNSSTGVVNLIVHVVNLDVCHTN